MLKRFSSGFQPTRSNSGRLNDEVYPTRQRLNLNNELFPEKLLKKFINDGIIGRDTYFWDAGKPIISYKLYIFVQSNLSLNMELADFINFSS